MIKYYYQTAVVKRPFSECLHYKAAALFVNAYQWLPTLLHSIFSKRKEYKYTVSLCLIFKNEARYLKEWLEYHLMIGVEHFYLYNNFSEDNYLEVLNPYIDKGIVTLTEYPYPYAQIRAYEDCYKRFKDESHWIGYIDADEFVNIIAYNDIKCMLKNYRHVPSLFLQWRMFGTSGYMNEDSSLVTERYTASWPWLCNLGKTFINNDYRFEVFGCHIDSAKYLGFKLFPVNLKRIAVPYLESLFSFNFEKKAYINHYWSKSYENHIYKDFAKGDADSEGNIETRKMAGRFSAHELNNSVRDYSIQRWLIMLKLRLSQK